MLSSALKPDFFFLLRILKPHSGSHSSRRGSFAADLGGSVGQPVSETEHPRPRCPALWHLDNWRMFSYQSSLVWCRHSQNMGCLSAPWTSWVPKHVRSGVRSREGSTTPMMPGVPRRWESGTIHLVSPSRPYGSRTCLVLVCPLEVGRDQMGDSCLGRGVEGSSCQSVVCGVLSHLCSPWHPGFPISLVAGNQGHRGGLSLFYVDTTPDCSDRKAPVHCL